MKKPKKHRQVYFSASYIKGGTFSYGVLLLALSLLIRFLQAFGNESLLVIIGNALRFAWIWIPIMLLFNMKAGNIRMARSNFYIIVNLFIATLGLSFAVSDLVGLISQFSVWRLIRLTLEVATLALPPLLLWSADKNRTDPDALLFILLGVASLILMVLLLIVQFALNKDNGTSFAQLLPDLLFYAGCMMFAISAFRKGVRIQNAMNRMYIAQRRKRLML